MKMLISVLFLVSVNCSAMIGATPEPNKDFLFVHDGLEYAIGYSDADESYALSVYHGGTWTWVIVEPCYEDAIKQAGGYYAYLDKFIHKVNDTIFVGGPNPEPETELDKLLNATANGLEYTPTGIVIK